MKARHEAIYLARCQRRDLNKLCSKYKIKGLSRLRHPDPLTDLLARRLDHIKSTDAEKYEDIKRDLIKFGVNRQFFALDNKEKEEEARAKKPAAAIAVDVDDVGDVAVGGDVDDDARDNKNVAGLTADVQRFIERRVNAVADGFKTEARSVLEVHVDDLISAKDKMVAEFQQAVSRAKLPTRFEVKDVETGDTRDMGLQHKRFGDLLQLLKSGCNVLLVGPAGSGKTTAAEKIVEAFGFDIETQFAPLLRPESKQEVFGFHNPLNDVFTKKKFYDVYKNGGVVMIDEIDRSNRKVLPMLFQVLANGHYVFPNGEFVRRHKKCFIIAGANTLMHGADRQYVSGEQQDGALRDRFVYLRWDYDEALEMELARSISEPHASDWVNLVWKVRRAVAAHNMRYVVSPRATIDGVKILATGGSKKLAKEAALYRDFTDDDRRKIEKEVA